MTELQELCNEFSKYSKRVLKRNISKNPQTLYRYEKDLIRSYNNILVYVDKKVDNFTVEKNEETKNILIGLRYKLVKCFGNLRVTIRLDPQILKLITEENIVQRPYSTEPLSSTINPGAQSFELSEESNSDGEYSDAEDQTKQDIEQSLSLLEQTLVTSDEDSDNTDDTDDTNDISEHDENTIAIMDAAQVVSLISKLCPNNFSGDPLTLNSFITSIDLVVSVVGVNQPAIVFAYIKSKLTGKALEAIPDDVATVNGIKEALKAAIKPENSKVIAGKMSALRADNKNKTEFAKVAEELAEAFQRASISEGIPQAKSMEMAIDETIKMCRNNSKTDLVKGILAASKFDSPAEVVAKYLVESSNEIQEKQILAYRAMKKNNYNGNNGRGRRNNGYNNGRGNYNNNSNRYNNNNNNNNGCNSNYRGRNGNYRGNNNNYRGNNRNNNNNNQGYNNWRNNNNSGYNNGNNNNNRNVRYTENWESPQQMMLGGNENSNNNNGNGNSRANRNIYNNQN